MNWLVPIDNNVKKLDTKWICVCDLCQHERIITYAQAWNLKKGNSKRTCNKCQYENKLRNIYYDGLKLGRTFHPAIRNKDKCTKTIIYRKLFAPETLSNSEMKIKQRNAKLGKYGKLSNAWNGGRANERQKIMARDEYKKFRKTVFIRDNYTCQICFIRGGILNMDHIKEWCNYPELRFEITNCRTLCINCHKKTSNFGAKAKRKK